MTYLPDDNPQSETEAKARAILGHNNKTYGYYTIVAALLSLELNGYPDNKTASQITSKAFGVPRETLWRWWQERERYLGADSGIASRASQAAKSNLRGMVLDFAERVLAEMTRPGRLEDASLSQLAVVFGILIDKAHALGDDGVQRVEVLHKLADVGPDGSVWDVDAEDVRALPPGPDGDH